MPVIQMGLASDTLSEQALFDVGNHFIRTQLATVQGTALPRPYGGKQGLISVDLDTTRLQATGLTPLDIVTAIGSKECHDRLSLHCGNTGGFLDLHVSRQSSDTELDYAA